MKMISKLWMVLLVAMSMSACEKKIERIVAEGGIAPQLTANKSAISLSFLTKDNEAVTLKWTNPNYKFSTGLSSQDVAYKVEIDTTGANFTNPNRKIIGISKEMSLTLTQNDLNDYLLNQLVLVPAMPHNIEVRITSTVGNGALPLYSNVMKFTVVPYAIPPKVTPPSTNKLYIVGSATPGGWNNPVPVPTQELTRVSPTMYTITLAMNAGQSYLFLPLNGDWNVKYGYIGSNNANNPSTDDFKQGGGDILAPAVSGNYKIEVDFQRGKFTLTKL